MRGRWELYNSLDIMKASEFSLDKQNKETMINSKKEKNVKTPKLQPSLPRSPTQKSYSEIVTVFKDLHRSAHTIA